MKKTTWPGIFRISALALGIALGSATPVYAVSFNIGDIEGQFDSSLSVGASWSVANPDNKLIGMANGGEAFTQTNDDGRQNFKKGETFSKIFKGIHDLELTYGSTGIFLRGKYWYDFELKDEGRIWKDIGNHNRKMGARASGAEMLDAFIYHSYSLGDMPGSVRLGKQVVSWGESTFIGNSINSINPVDVSAFRRPGAEIKEGLIPVNMFYVSQTINDRLSAEAFYQLEWDQTIVDNCGTFFSSTDVVADGCNNNYHILDPATIAGVIDASNAGLLPGVQVGQEGLVVQRGGDRDARDSGQWGLALRWLGDETEYGVYAMNYHSRTPIVSMQNANTAGIIDTLTVMEGRPEAEALALALPMLLGRGSYFLEYPEDIRLYGVSFSTTLPTGTSWSGELSYRPNMPLQTNTSDLTPNLANTVADGLAAGGVAGAVAQAGVITQGYQRKEVTQAQTTLVHFFEQVMGAGRLVVLGELGYTRVGAMTNEVNNRFGRDATFGVPENALAAQRYGSHGFYTSSSWGYRARGVLEYSDVFAGINLKPGLAWSHDVDGYGPVFTEGNKAISIGLDAEYLNTYTASLSYTNFFGGDYNVQSDRDFIALSFGLSF